VTEALVRTPAATASRDLVDAAAKGGTGKPANRLTVGIFVTTVRPHSPSQARLQARMLEGLRASGADRHEFVVLSNDAAPDPDLGWPHHVLRRRGRWSAAVRRAGARIAGALAGLGRLAGVSGGRTLARLDQWRRAEPAHYQQLRDLNVRIVWNMHHHALTTPTPFIRTIWDVNQRILPMYPEYAYVRYGFEGLDAGLAESLARASYVITGTAEGRRQLVELYGTDHRKIRIVPFLAPVLPVGEAAGVDGRYILYPSRFWPHKNHVVVLEALHILRARHGLDLKCVFAGSDGGNLDYVMRYAERLGVRDLIDYRGRVSEEELGALYAGAWALTYASGVGPDNLPPLEAMALGCPVITADVPGAEDQFGEAALRFPPTDEAALAAQLMRLDREPGLREELIRRGSALAARLPLEGYVAAVLEILDEFAKVARAWERCDSLRDSAAAF
jgi:glycosyltransferase involved in cell wall biosynthesis